MLCLQTAVLALCRVGSFYLTSILYALQQIFQKKKRKKKVSVALAVEHVVSYTMHQWFCKPLMHGQNDRP